MNKKYSFFPASIFIIGVIALFFIIVSGNAAVPDCAVSPYICSWIVGDDYSRVNRGLLVNPYGASTGLIVANGNVGIGTTTPAAKLDVDGAVILGNTFADQIRMNGKLIYGGVARSYGIFLNGKIYCGSGINFGQYSFECKYPVVDIISPVMESEVPIYMEYNTSPVTVAYQYLNIICSTLGGKYLSHTITGSSVVGNVLRADVNTIVGESVGSKTIGWRSVDYYLSQPGYFRFGNVSCSYDFHY